jgi:hypothetical protein
MRRDAAGKSLNCGRGGGIYLWVFTYNDITSVKRK